MDLSTTYLGLKLSSPLITGSSPLTDNPDTVRKLADHGAAALVMHSIYQEQITHERIAQLFYEDMYTNTSEEARSEYPPPNKFAHTPKSYLEHICNIKSAVRIPLIASINCTSRGAWTSYATEIQSAGADALELNIYFVPTNPEETASDVESRVVDIVHSIRERIQIPLAVKLSPYYSSLPNLVRQIEGAGANGLVIFNRFYQPDFEVETKSPINKLNLSSMSDLIELRLRLRWLAILAPQTKLSLSLTGGVHSGLDAIKGIMAGAHTIQIVSALLNAGPEYLDFIRNSLVHYMQQLGVESVQQLRGCMVRHTSDPSAVERGGYLSILHKWNEECVLPDGLHAF